MHKSGIESTMKLQPSGLSTVSHNGRKGLLPTNRHSKNNTPPDASKRREQVSCIPPTENQNVAHDTCYSTEVWYHRQIRGCVLTPTWPEHKATCVPRPVSRGGHGTAWGEAPSL